MDLDRERLLLKFKAAADGGDAFLAEHLDAEASVPSGFTDAGVIDRLERRDGDVVLEKVFPPPSPGA
jgi:hypothetical protein